MKKSIQTFEAKKALKGKTLSKINGGESDWSISFCVSARMQETMAKKDKDSDED